MDRKTEQFHIDVKSEEERLKKITEILSDGVYVYLKKKGLLKEGSGQRERIKILMDKTKEIAKPNDEEYSVDFIETT